LYRRKPSAIGVRRDACAPLACRRMNRWLAVGACAADVRFRLFEPANLSAADLL